MESMAGEVADVLAVASAVHERILLVGHSSGAVVALEAAIASPEAFAGLVLHERPVPFRARSEEMRSVEHKRPSSAECWDAQ
jgi:pimeloyl-ACP methyl ester carboxylesterase